MRCDCDGCNHVRVTSIKGVMPFEDKVYFLWFLNGIKLKVRVV